MGVDLDFAVSLIKQHEGFKQYPYHDSVGRLTVGWGHNLDANGLSPAVCEFVLQEDVAQVVDQLNHALPWWSELDSHRAAVLVNMGFNLGVPGLLKFTAMLTALRAKQFDHAAQAMLDSLWAKQVGKRATELASIIRGH